MVKAAGATSRTNSLDPVVIKMLLLLLLLERALSLVVGGTGHF
jgi:hypothetical protein